MASVFCVGHAVQDFVFSVEEIPKDAIKHRASAFTSVGGGPAATAAVAIARLGGDVSLAARLGNDSVADVIEAELSSYGVDCSSIKRFEDARSSLSSVFVDSDGERMIVNYLDETLPTDPDWLPLEQITRADVVLADSRWPAGAARALETAKSAGKYAVMDADLPVPRAGVLEQASHIAFSSDGLRDFAGHEDWAQALDDVHIQTGAWCCVTLGADGVQVRDTDGHQSVPGFAVKPVDTLGAGDVWHGAFALALAEGTPELEAVRFANAASAIKVTRPGGRAGTPDRAEVTSFINTQNAELAS